MRQGFAILAMTSGFLAGCMALHQDRARDLSNDGLHLYRRGAYADARDTFLLALKIRPDDPDLMYNLGRCHDRLGNAEQARRSYDACLKQAPDHPEARHAVIVQLVEGGKLEEARTTVREWLRNQPGLASPYVEDGWLRARDGDLDTARARFQQALDLEPRNARGLVELARIYEKLDRPDRAVVLYERSLEVNPDQPLITSQVKELRSRGISKPHPD